MNNVIILAAGKGKRMQNLLPKCLNKIIDKCVIDYLILELNKIKFDQKICVVNSSNNLIQEHLKDEFIYAYQEEQLGTANAVKACLNLIDDEGYSVILCADTPLVSSDILNKLISNHLKSNNDLTFLTTMIDNPHGYGRIIRKKRKIKIVEQKDCNYKQDLIKEVNLGIYCINNRYLKYLNNINNDNNSKEYYFPDIIKFLNKVEALKVEYSYNLEGFNDLRQLCELELNLKKAINLSHLSKGVRIIDPVTTTIGRDVVIEPNVIIYPNCYIIGKSIIKTGAIIKNNSTIENSYIGSNTIVSNSVIENSKILDDCQIGPFAHIRNESIINNNVRIGNYVEVKKSIIGNNTKAAHLTYLGNVKCGKNVNFGAGVISANYDGKHKFSTTIGDNVFVGSNANLIAPIEIGSNSFIACGSTITDSIADYDMAIARSRQVTKRSYMKDKKEPE